MKKLLVIVLVLSVLGVFVASFRTDKGKDEEQGKYVAVIRIQGPLYGTSVEGLTGRTNGADEIMRQLIAARKDKSVAAVLLRIDTPGGSVTAAEEITAELEKMKKQGKVVVSSMGDVAASAGYWLATCTDYIYANPSTLTGSIGVYVPYTNVEELYKKIGLSQERIKSGPYKDMMAAERPMTASERKILQTMVDEMYEAFVKQVSKGRGLPEDKVRQLADGRIYTGRQAKELGLVDELGNYYDALDATAKRAGLEGTPKVKEYDEPFSLQRLLKVSLTTLDVKSLLGFSQPELQQKGFY